MNEERWLLPFTFGVDVAAITTVLQQAMACNATLVAVSLVTSGEKGQGARLEHLQQSQDFLETVQHLASRYHVRLERHEILTSASGAALADEIARIAREFDCECCVIVTRGPQELLLCKDEIRALLTAASLSFLLCRLSPLAARPSLETRLRLWFSELVHHTFGQKEDNTSKPYGQKEREQVAQQSEQPIPS